MVNEYDVRQEMEQIEKARMHPIRKARRLLLLTRKVRRAARKFERGIEIMVRDCMDDEAARMQDACDRLVALGREVREVATRTLAAARNGEARTQPS
jgi:hypothetical protein